MEAKNLRVGNLVGIEKTALHADGCNHLKAMFEIEELKNDVAQFKGYQVSEYYKDLKGIKLNEKMLSLYGFKRSSDKLIYLPVPKINSEIHFEKHTYGNVITLQSSVGMFIPNDIEYFHELQNLFFAITGEELELKHKTLNKNNIRKKTIETKSHTHLSDISEVELRNKITDVLSDISRMEAKGEWHGFMHDKKNAGMITKLWDYCK